ncbi:MAG: PEP-CTERM sorting domain-containing protein [Phycisphaerae bacterium]
MSRFLITTLALALVPCVASADVIAEWDIANATGRSAQFIGGTEGVSGSDLTTHGLNTWNPRWGVRGLVAARNWGRHDRAIPGKYVEFSVTGEEMTFESITFALTRGNAGGGHGAESWALRSSVDGFSDDLAAVSLEGTGIDHQTIFEGLNISALGTQSGTVTFRLYGYDNTSRRDYSGLVNAAPGTCGIRGRGSNVILHGDVGSIGGQAVPEPASMALFATGGIAVLLRRKS